MTAGRRRVGETVERSSKSCEDTAALTVSDVREKLAGYSGPGLTLMEVCGSHTRAIAASGIDGIISPRIRLLSGPGCPVCVTPTSYIDRLIELGQLGCRIITFGDLIRVPGSERSLAEAKADGVEVRMVYSPLEVIKMAEEEPQEDFVVAAIGFETTIPVFAALVSGLVGEKIRNVRLLTALKTMPPVIRYLMDSGASIDGFIAPGHVSVITGSDVFHPLAEDYGIPFAVSGFSGEQLLVAIYDLVLHSGEGIVRNDYPSVVTEQGNREALSLVKTFFEPADAVWRGMGVIPGSGLVLKGEFAFLDAGSRGLIRDEKKNRGCICGEILRGEKVPADCPLFGTICRPSSPQGACMVSSEGSCFTGYIYRREENG